MRAASSTPSASTHLAFSLVELSIVLVILGLLVGGILSGQSLIRAAELRSVTTDYTRYITAGQTFRDKYFAIPGDMNNAVSFWGASTANGNGDGKMSYAAGAGLTGECFQVWNQLALAGLIEGTYTGLSGTNHGYHAVIGTNVPKSKISNAGFSFHDNPGTLTGNINHYDGNYNNWVFFGGPGPNGSVTYGAVLKPEEMWNIDTKLDDGKAVYGNLVALKNTMTPGCTTSDLMTAEYNLTNSSTVCAISFKNNF